MSLALCCTIRLGITTLTDACYDQLVVGDVLLLESLVSEPLDLCIEGVTLCRGAPGLQGSHKAFYIKEMI